MCHLRYSYMLVVVVLTLFGISDINYANEVPAVFVFGDSLLDVGNNNYFRTLGKANYKPYGIDFGRPSGRFTNGRTMVDVLGKLIGVHGYIPPFLSPNTTGAVVLKGVNYASGSAGILNRTGRIAIRNINMDAQLGNFANTRKTIRSMLGNLAARKLLRRNALFMVGIGSNDFILHYLIPIVSKPRQYFISPTRFVSTLIKRFRLQLKRLYAMDARKYIVAGVAPIGCTPAMKDTNPTDSPAHCFEKANEIAQMFNTELEKLVSNLGKELKGSAFVYVNIYHIFSDILKNYKSYGFENANSACCRFLGKNGGIFSCNRFSRICQKRDKYVFWDGFHPTDAVNVIVAKRILDGRAPSVSPMNVRRLMRLQPSLSIIKFRRNISHK